MKMVVFIALIKIKMELCFILVFLVWLDGFLLSLDHAKPIQYALWQNKTR